MGDFEFNIDPGRPGARIPTWLTKILLIVSLIPFVAFGIFMVTKILHIANGRNYKFVIPFILFTLFLVAFPVVGTISALRKMKNAPRPGSSPLRADKPWLARPDWAAGKIKSSMGRELGIYIFFGLMFCGIGGACVVFVLPKELQRQNYWALLILIFPLVGLGFWTTAIQQWRSRRRYGDDYFVMASVPAPLGGALQGSIQIGAPFKPQQGLELRLSCIRRWTRGENNSQDILWQNERFLKNDAVSAQSGLACIPVYFQLPADQPETFSQPGESIFWALEAKAKMSGPNLRLMFDVPVFKVADAVPATSPDPNVPLPRPVELLQRDPHSKIKVTDARGGREFFFPAARNPGVATFVTIFMLVWAVAEWVLIRQRAPILFPIFFGLSEVLLVWGSFGLWFRETHVIVNPTAVHAQKRWLFFSRTRSFRAMDVSTFVNKPGMRSNQQLYYDIQLATQAGRKTTVASAVPVKGEADWLVQEMNRALGRIP